MSVYVDDFRMVGKKENLKEMWTALREDLDLEPEAELSHNVYLGCNQRDAPIFPDLIKEKSELFHRLATHEAQRQAQHDDKSPKKYKFRQMTSKS